jgi:hypothetical protein
MIPIKRKIAESKHASRYARESVYVGDDETIKECDGMIARVRGMVDRITIPDIHDREIMEMPYDVVRERLGIEKVGGDEGSGTYEAWMRHRLDMMGWMDQSLEKATPHVFIGQRKDTTGENGVKAANEWLAAQVKNLVLREVKPARNALDDGVESHVRQSQGNLVSSAIEGRKAGERPGEREGGRNA